MKVLMTGFDPFGGESINPSFEAVKLLPDTIGQAEIVKLELPTVFKKSIDVLLSTMVNEKPEIVICVGQAGGRSEISMEAIGINVSLGRIPDNEGYKPLGEKIAQDGHDGYFSNLPIHAMARHLNTLGIPAGISYTAGTYVCNHVLYALMHHIRTNDLPIKGGFIHVPYLPAQASGKRNMPHMTLEMIRQGLVEVVEVALQTSVDQVTENGGRED